MSSFNNSQLVALAIAPKCSAFLSILGSSYIIVKIVTSKSRRKRVHQRLLAGMSILDAFQSLAHFFSTWPIPAEDTYVKYAIGNNKTCSAQGFFINFNVGVALYHASLSVYYLLVIKYKFQHKRIQKIEMVMHTLPVFYIIVSGIFILMDDSFNNSGFFCWIASSRCEGDACLRGRNAMTFLWIVLGLASLCMLIASICIFLLWLTIRKQELGNRNRNIRFHIESRNVPGAQNTRPRSYLQDSARQSVMFLGAFFMSWTIPIIDRILFHIYGYHIFVLYLASGILHPLQGAFNILVFMRKSTKRERKTTNEDPPEPRFNLRLSFTSMISILSGNKLNASNQHMAVFQDTQLNECVTILEEGHNQLNNDKK